MMQGQSGLRVLPCQDSEELASACRRELGISRDRAAALGQSALAAIRDGFYVGPGGQRVDWADAVAAVCAAKRSIRPGDALPAGEWPVYPETVVQVSNETTLGASWRLVERGMHPLALNFANGLHAGGGFLGGARAQEEVLCRSSALYQALVGDPMYAAHAVRRECDSTDWAIYSPDVPVFRRDDGTALERPWLLDFITCAAPVAHRIGQPRAGDLLQRRIHRVLAIARAYGHPALVLGAWGCGAFNNDPHRTASDFRQALETEFRGAFAEVVFAIADWSPERRFLGPFRDAFAAPTNR